MKLQSNSHWAPLLLQGNYRFLTIPQNLMYMFYGVVNSRLCLASYSVLQFSDGPSLYLLHISPKACQEIISNLSGLRI